MENIISRWGQIAQKILPKTGVTMKIKKGQKRPQKMPVVKRLTSLAGRVNPLYMAIITSAIVTSCMEVMKADDPSRKAIGLNLKRSLLSRCRDVLLPFNAGNGNQCFFNETTSAIKGIRPFPAPAQYRL